MVYSSRVISWEKALFVTPVLPEVMEALFLEDGGQSDKLLFMCIWSQG